MYEYDDNDGEGRSRAGILAALLLVAAIAAVGWFVVKPRLSSDDAQESPVAAASTIAESADGTTTTDAGADGPSTTERPATTEATTTSASSTGSVTDASAATSVPTSATTTSVPTASVPTTSVPATSVSASAGQPTTTPAASTTVAPPPTTAAVGGYDTLPDGSPVPVVAIFDVGVVTLNGVVPDQAAVDRLGGLALANSRDPAATTLVNNLIVNPAVPTNVGVRVIELTSTRFPEASAEILLLHAAELNRVAAVMNALTNVSVLVIGHADQRGDEAANFAISEARARSVVNYLASQGIDPSRLSSRAVGEADLLSINNDAASLALNRRTEFIFYGLILG